MTHWSFVIIFDKKKINKSKYTEDILYDYIDKNVKRYNIKRISQNQWKADENNKANSQYNALSLLTKQDWIMKNVKSIIAYENNSKPIDYLAIVKEYFPERMI